jgi:hypothetical protein
MPDQDVTRKPITRFFWVTGIMLLAGCATTPDRLLPHSAAPTHRPIWIFQITLPGVLRSPRSRLVVPMDVTFINTSRQVIQDLHFTFAAYDSLGMPLVQRWSGRQIAMALTAPGPFVPGDAYEISTQPRGFPDMGTSCVELKALTIAPRGAPAFTVSGSKALAPYLSPVLRGTCKDLGPALFLLPQNGR